MFDQSARPRSVLQRRSNVSNTVQAGLDGLAVIALAWGLVERHIGAMTLEYSVLIVLLVAVMAFVYDHYALYRHNTTFTIKSLTLFKAWTVCFLALLLGAFLAERSEAFSRQLVLELFVLGYAAQLLLHLLSRKIQRTWTRRAGRPENVVIVGEGRLAGYLYQKISANPWLHEQVVGVVPLGEGERPETAPGAETKLQVLGGLDDLPELIGSCRIRSVYIVTPLESSRVVERIYAELLDKNVAIHWIPDIFALRLVNHNVKEIAGIPVLTLAETPLTGTRFLLKGVEDLVLGFLSTVAIAPLLLAIAFAVKLDSPGPVFFRQNRTGWNGNTFRIWKFRSMYVHPPEAGRLIQARKDDPRITRVGAFLRKTSLDELPQLFNVLKGEMSLVGPRPHAVQHDEEYSRRIADYFARLNIKPGMTGLAQVRGYRGETQDLDLMIRRVESDIEYINNWSLWLDLVILLRTVTVLTGRNVY